MGKTISSRIEEDAPVEALQELLFVTRDVLSGGIDEDDMPMELNEVIDALYDDVLNLATVYADSAELNDQMAHDIISLTVANVGLGMDLNHLKNVLSGLTAPTMNEELIDDALMVLTKEGEIKTLTIGADILNTKVSFNEEELREALCSAIRSYNHELAAKLYRLRR